METNNVEPDVLHFTSVYVSKIPKTSFGKSYLQSSNLSLNKAKPNWTNTLSLPHNLHSMQQFLTLCIPV